MKHKYLYLSVALAFILALLPVFSASAAPQKFWYLDWRQVVPAGSGDPNMSGHVYIDVNAGQSRLCYTLDVFVFYGDWPPTSATIHKAPVGFNGPLVVDLNPTFVRTASPTASGCLQIDSQLAHEIQQRPADYYLLVTNSTHPDGAARAQLQR